VPGDQPPDAPPPDDRPPDESLLSGVSRAAWRSMTWPLEASRLLRAGSPIPSGPMAWRDSWLDATRWWTDALTAGARLGAGADARLLVELAGGVARAFRGRRVAVNVNGRRVRAELESIWLEPKGRRYAGRLELRSVECDGLEVEALSVLADEVTLVMTPDVALVMSGVELRGRSAPEPLVAWLDTKLTEWSVAVAEDHLIEAVRRRGGRRYVVHVAIRDGQAEVELRAVRLRRVTLPCPRWLRLTRKLALPPLPGGLSLTEARHLETGVEFKLSMPSLRQTFDPGRVRQAILSPRSSGSAPIT
jgi:hypothetical protein